MKKTLLTTIFISLLLIACSPQKDNPQTEKIETVNEVLDAIKKLDSEYNTSFRREQMNKVILNTDEIESYLRDLENISQRVDAKNQQQGEWINWTLQARKEMLLSQFGFQQAWVGVGKSGRVSEGFSCNDFNSVQKSSLLLERSLLLGNNATSYLDALLTENMNLSDEIGVDENKPAFYNSKFDAVYVELQRNAVAMNEFCNQTVQFNHYNFTKLIEETDVNTSKYKRGATNGN